MSKSYTGKDHSSFGEFDLINRLSEFADAKKSAGIHSVLTGIGDDTAVVSTPSGELLLTTDALVDGVHFRSVDERWHDVGWKCAVSNLSDIASMGGFPDHALVTIGIPKDFSHEIFTEIYTGMDEAFSRFGGQIVGGDVVSSPNLFVNLALTGHPSQGRDGTSAWLTRAEARPGDLVCVTGPLGGAAGGLKLILAGKTDKSSQALTLIDRHFRPTPRVEIGQKLVGTGARCAIDISDGLVGDLEKIAAASSVGINVEMSDVPLPDELFAEFGNSAIDLALGGGEDYELAFTVPESDINEVLEKVGPDITVIGRVNDTGVQSGEVKILDTSGSEYQLGQKGWDHLNA